MVVTWLAMENPTIFKRRYIDSNGWFVIVMLKVFSILIFSRVIPDFQGPPRTWDPLMVGFPYHSHIFQGF